jgi:hypothetical protein
MAVAAMTKTAAAAMATATAIATTATAMATAMAMEEEVSTYWERRAYEICVALGGRGVMILAPSFVVLHIMVNVLLQLRTDSVRCRAEAVCARPR